MIYQSKIKCRLLKVLTRLADQRVNEIDPAGRESRKSRRDLRNFVTPKMK